MPTVIDYANGFAVGDYVYVTEENKYYQISKKDNIRLPYTYSTAVSAGTTTSDIAITQLNPKSDELYQVYNIVPQHNAQVYVKQPASTLRWGTNSQSSTSFVSDRLNTYDGGEVYNIFMRKEEYPSIQIKNNTLISLATTTIFFLGWKYKMKELGCNARPPVNYTTIQMGGFD